MINTSLIINNMTSVEKDRLLSAIIDQIPEAKVLFMKQFGHLSEQFPIEASYPSFIEAIERNSQEWCSLFEEIDLEQPDWHQWRPPYGSYITEDEAYTMLAEQQIEEICKLWAEEEVNYLLSQDSSGFFGGILAMYIAASTAEIKDEMGIFWGNPNKSLLDSFETEIRELKVKVSKASFDLTKLTDAANHTFRYFAEKGFSAGPLTLSLDKLMEWICNENATIKIFGSAIQQVPDSDLLFPVTSVLYSRAIDGDDWTIVADKLAAYNQDVAKDLMLHYLSENRYDDFHRIAVESFLRDDYHWTPFIVERLDPGFDTEFAKTVLLRAAELNKEMGHYRRASRYMKDEERLVYRQKHQGNTYYYGLLLAEEKEYQQLVELLERDRLFIGTDFEVLAGLLAEEMPVRAFEIIRQKCLKLMSGERKRHTYNEIAGMLLSVSKPANCDQIQKFVLELYNTRPPLPALKDELKKAGLLKGLHH